MIPRFLVANETRVHTLDCEFMMNIINLQFPEVQPSGEYVTSSDNLIGTAYIYDHCCVASFSRTEILPRAQLA